MFNQGYYDALMTLGLCKSGEALPDILNKTRGAVKKMVTRFRPKAVPDIVSALKNETTPPSIQRATNPVKLKSIPKEFFTPPKRMTNPTIQARRVPVPKAEPAVSPVASTMPSVVPVSSPVTAPVITPEVKKRLLEDPRTRAGLLGAGVGAGLMGGGALLEHNLSD